MFDAPPLVGIPLGPSHRPHPDDDWLSVRVFPLGDFDRLARQHEAIGGGLADTKQNKRETQIWARVYREAANDVRATSFDGWDALVAERDALRKALEHAATALESASYYFGDATNAAFARTSAEIARAALSKAEG